MYQGPWLLHFWCQLTWCYDDYDDDDDVIKGCHYWHTCSYNCTFSMVNTFQKGSCDNTTNTSHRSGIADPDVLWFYFSQILLLLQSNTVQLYSVTLKPVESSCVSSVTLPGHRSDVRFVFLVCYGLLRATSWLSSPSEKKLMAFLHM